MRFLPAALFSLAILGVAGVAGATAPTVTCSSATACYVYQNTSNGPGVHAQSTTGYGLRSNSGTGGGLLGTTASGSYLSPGVEGESSNQSSIDAAGGFGLAGAGLPATTPEFGIISFGNSAGVEGLTVAPGTPAASGAGVFGYDGGTSATSLNAGVSGRSASHGTGVLGEANGSPSDGVLGQGIPVGVYGVGDATTGTPVAVGVEAESNAFPLEIQNSTDESIVEIGSHGYVLTANANGATKLSIDDSGNEILGGKLTAALGIDVRTLSASGAVKMAYGARTTSPQLEDVGEGQLLNGRAAIRIDAALEDVIDQRNPYHVFVTPEGDCNGLYVAQKSPAGFVVRELRGGRSNLAFEYRIVAKPVDQSGQRLAAQPSPRSIGPAYRLRPKHLAPMLPVMDVLKARLGPDGFAKAIAAFQKREASK